VTRRRSEAPVSWLALSGAAFLLEGLGLQGEAERVVTLAPDGPDGPAGEEAWSLEALLKGTMHWPSDPAERDVCYFLAQGLRARLAKELPASRAEPGGASVQLAHRAKALLTELAEISVEAAQMVVAGAQNGVSEDGSDATLPAWFMVEVVRDLPRLAAARDGTKV
jgi:hypothetical protein